MMEVRNIYSGASFFKYTVCGKPFLYSNRLCRLIIFIFKQKYLSVVRVVVGKIIFTALFDAQSM